MKYKIVHPRVLVIALVGLFLNLIQLNAQNYTFKHSTTRDGISSGFIWKIYEDSKGFMWIGTNSGLNRYDGYTFKNYLPNSEDQGSISGQIVRDIVELDSTTFLIGTNIGLEIFDPTAGIFHFATVNDSLPKLSQVAGIELLENGDIWITTFTGLYHLPRQNLYNDKLEARFYQLSNDSSENEEIAFNSMAYDGDKTIWVGSDKYLHKFDMNSFSFVDIGPFNKDVETILRGNIWNMHLYSTGDLVITSTTGLVIWKKRMDEPEAVTELGPFNKKELAEASFQSITEDDEGWLWLGTGLKGAIKWNLKMDQVSVFRHDPFNENSINSDDVHYAYTDNHNNTWFGYHDLGISIMWSNSWKYDHKLATDDFDAEHETNNLFNVSEDAAGNLWFPTREGLVYHPINGDKPKVYKLGPDTTGDDGFGLTFMEENSLLLVSTNGNVLYSFDKNTEIFTEIPLTDSLGIATVYVTDTPTKHLFSTLSGEIIAVDKSTFDVSRIKIPLDSSRSPTMTPTLIGKDIEGNYLTILLYIEPGNLYWENYTFDPDSLIFKKTEIEIPENVSNLNIPHISKYQTGVIWINLNFGIFRQNIITGDSELLFQSETGVIGEGSRIICEDSEGYLWMNNQTGVMRMDPLTESIENYEIVPEKGPAQLLNPVQLRNGDILFMGMGGYIRFDPKELQQQDPIQDIYITELITGSEKNEPIFENSKYEFESSANNISISYLGINYRDAAFTRYRYKIEGYDESWNIIGNQRNVYLPNLPPGNYTFKVQASPRFGSFSESTASVQFTINPPWWQTVTAYLSYFLLLVGGIFTIDRFQRKRLVTRERERTREIELKQAREIEKAYTELKATQKQLIHSEKMASLGELTAGIAHEIQNPLNFVNNFSEVSADLMDEMREEIKAGNTGDIEEISKDVKQNLEKISFHGHRASSIVKGMLGHSREGDQEKELTDLNVLADEYLRLAYHGMRAKDKSFMSDYKTDLDDSLPEIEIISQDIGRVVLNLVNNAFYAVSSKAIKYREAGTTNENKYKPLVTITTKKMRNGIEIRVKDNGDGIPDHIKDKIFQPFFTTKPSGDGTGLGLSLSYDIITKGHEGDLNVSSSPESGTEFIITLPNK